MSGSGPVTQALWQHRAIALRVTLIGALLTSAAIVLLLFDIGSIGAQGNEDEESFFDCADCILYFCSHPGASRHADSTWLNGDSSDGDIIAIHPTFGDYTESISEGGTWPNQGWGTYNYWSGIAWQHGDGTCSIRASFRINGVVAEADYWPCPVKTDRTLTERDFASDDPEATKTIEVWEVRIWLNRSKVEDELDIECSAESPAIPLEDQGSSTTSSTSQTPQPPQNPNNSGGVQQETVNTNVPPSNADPPPADDKLTQTSSNNGQSSTFTPVSDSDDGPTQPPAGAPDNEEEQQETVNTNAPPSNDDSPPADDKLTQTSSNNGQSSTFTPMSDSDETPTQRVVSTLENEEEQQSSPPIPDASDETDGDLLQTENDGSRDREPSQPQVSTQGNEEEQQSSPPTPDTSDDTEDDLLEAENDDSSDQMEHADDQSDDDLMEQAEPTMSASQDDERPQESEATTQTTRPRVPRTGTGGAADSQSEDGLSRGLAPFVASVAAIGIVSLILYRRLRKVQSR